MSSRQSISPLIRFLGRAFAFMAFGLAATVAQAADVTLAWEEVLDPDAALYRIYHREADGVYTFDTPVWEGDATSCTLTALIDGTTHYFVGRSVDSYGNESVDSNEIAFHAPVPDLDDPIPSPEPDPHPISDDPLPEPPPSPLAVDPNTLFDADLVDHIGTHWTVLDQEPPGARVVTAYDALRQSQATDLVGDWINNSFVLARVDGEPLAGGGPWLLAWDIKGTPYFFVSIVLQTSGGEKTLYYTPSDFDLLGQGGSVHHGLGIGSADGRWHTHERHLDADLWEAQPGTRLEGILEIHIRGRVQVDDINLTPFP